MHHPALNRPDLLKRTNIELPTLRIEESRPYSQTPAAPTCFRPAGSIGRLRTRPSAGRLRSDEAHKRLGAGRAERDHGVGLMRAAFHARRSDRHSGNHESPHVGAVRAGAARPECCTWSRSLPRYRYCSRRAEWSLPKLRQTRPGCPHVWRGGPSRAFSERVQVRQPASRTTERRWVTGTVLARPGTRLGSWVPFLGAIVDGPALPVLMQVRARCPGQPPPSGALRIHRRPSRFSSPRRAPCRAGPT